MAEGRGDTLLATIIEGHDATVAQRQLQATLALLAGHLARHATVHLVGEPVLAGHGLQLQHATEILLEMGRVIGYGCIVALDALVAHDGLGRVAEHLGHVEIERLHAIALDEGEVGVARGLADHIHRGTLALGDLRHMGQVLLVDEQSHALLRLVGDNLLGAQRLVADGQLGHVDLAATLLHQLRETVEVACRSVVVDGDHGVVVLLHEGAHEVVGALLHLGVGTLDGVELDTIAIAARIDRRYRSTTQSDAVVVATDHDDLVARLRFLLQAVALRAVADAAGKHDHLVVGIFLVILLVLEGEEGSRDEGLAKLVAEVAGAIGGLDENLLRRLVEPLAHGQYVLPVAQGGLLAVVALQSGIGRHIDCRARDGP